MRLLAAGASIALAILAIASAASPARAHATLVSSDPEDGAVVAAPPRQFMLTFNEPVAPLVLRLVTANGSIVLASRSGRGATLVVEAPAEIPNGTHVLSWRVVSLDGHPVGGSVVFSIGAPGAGPIPDVENTTTPAVAALLWAAKLVVYCGLFVGIGGAFFGAWIAPLGTKPARGIISATIVVGLVVVPLSVGLQGLDALGLPLPALGGKVAWVAGLETSYGLTAAAAAFSLFAALFSVEARSVRVARALSLFGMLGIGLALALSGHASAAEPQPLMRAGVFVHAACVAFWIGSLVPLAALLRRDPDGALRALAAFSRFIPFAIVPLVLSGAVLALVQVERPGALLSTAYGRLLTLKLVLVIALLLIAAWNRFRLTPAVARGQGAARRHLARSVSLEVVLALAVFGLVAAWRFTPPPRAIAIAASRPATLHIHTAKAMADVRFQPGRAGPARISVMLLSGDFGGLDTKEVTLTFRNDPAGIEPLVRPAARNADGYWIVDNLVIPVPGRWTVGIDVLVNDFEKVPLDGTVDIRP